MRGRLSSEAFPSKSNLLLKTWIKLYHCGVEPHLKPRQIRQYALSAISLERSLPMAKQAVEREEKGWWNKPLASGILGAVLSPIILSLLTLLGSFLWSWGTNGGLISILGGVKCGTQIHLRSGNDLYLSNRTDAQQPALPSNLENYDARFVRGNKDAFEAFVIVCR
jgi:hypothetical protein